MVQEKEVWFCNMAVSNQPEFEDRVIQIKRISKKTKGGSKFSFSALVAVGDKKKIELSIGFSHPVVYNAPDGVDFEVLDNKAIVIRGIDKQLVGLVASKIRSMRVPEPYKGKGIHYVGEVVRRKPGKAGKA